MSGPKPGSGPDAPPDKRPPVPPPTPPSRPPAGNDALVPGEDISAPADDEVRRQPGSSVISNPNDAA